MPLDRNPHGSPLALMTVTLSTNMRQAGEGWCRLKNTHASWKFAYSYMQRIDWIASDSESPESGSSAMIAWMSERRTTSSETVASPANRGLCPRSTMKTNTGGPLRN